MNPLTMSAGRSWPVASIIVGTSGNADERVLLNMPSARSWPPRIYVTAVGSGDHAIGTWPPSVDADAGPPPLNGTWVMSTSNASLNNSPARCAGVPLAAEASLNLPGLAFATATSTLTVVAGVDGWTTSTCGDEHISEIGSKSLYG